MPKVMPVGTGELAIHYKNASDSENYELVFGLNPDGAPDVGDVGATVTAACNHINDYWSSSYSFVGWTFRHQDDADFQQIMTGTLSIAGLISTAVDKQNVCYLIKKSTAIAGRSGKGRMYLSGVINSYSTDGGVLTATPLSNWNTKLALFLAQLSTDGFPMVLFHDVATTHPLYGVATPVTALTMETTLATQRRRLRR